MKIRPFFTVCLTMCAVLDGLAAEGNLVCKGRMVSVVSPTEYGCDADHIIQIDSDGTFLSKEAKADPDAAISRILSGVVASHKLRIVLYIHGGRVTMGQALGTARRVGPVIYGDPTESGYPIFICWETGDLSTYKDHLAYQRNGISYHHTAAGDVSILTAPLQLGADLGRGISRLAVNTVANFGTLLQNSDLLPASTRRIFPVKQQYQDSLKDYKPAGLTIEAAIKCGFVYPEQAPEDRLKLSVGADADRYQLKFVVHQAMTIPLQIASEGLLDSIGTAEWSNMVGRTRNMFHPPRNYLPQDPSTSIHLGAGTLFFGGLRKLLLQYPRVNLDIYAHSMGSMVTNEAFAQFSDLRVSNIVFMAAACSIRQFASTTGRHIAQYNTPFYNLSLHPRAELDEVEAFGVPLRGSLLTWIDEFFECPPAFGDRTLGTFENVIIAHDQLPKCSQFYLKAFGIENARGRHCTYAGPQKHGEFEQFYFWHRDFREPCLPGKRYGKIPGSTPCREKQRVSTSMPGQNNRVRGEKNAQRRS